MSKFDELESSNSSDGFVEVTGVFTCQQCDKDVEIALYDTFENKMKWICVDKHTSVIDLEL